MILIVGGTFQGKKAFAEKLLNEKREDFTDGTSCAFSDIYHAKVLFHFHGISECCWKQKWKCAGSGRTAVDEESGSCPDQQRTRIRRGSDGCV